MFHGSQRDRPKAPLFRYWYMWLFLHLHGGFCLSGFSCSFFIFIYLFGGEVLRLVIDGFSRTLIVFEWVVFGCWEKKWLKEEKWQNFGLYLSKVGVFELFGGSFLGRKVFFFPQLYNYFLFWMHWGQSLI